MKKVLIIDIETTGFSHSESSIVEVGIVSLDLNTGSRAILLDKVTYEEKTTINEIKNSWFYENTDFNGHELLESGELLTDLLPEIQRIIDSYPLGSTAYNNDFDYGFLESRAIKFPKKLPCPMKLSTPICKIKGKYKGYKYPKCQEAYDFFFPDEDYLETHRAADDAYHEAKIVHELWKRGVFNID